MTKVRFEWQCSPIELSSALLIPCSGFRCPKPYWNLQSKSNAVKGLMLEALGIGWATEGYLLEEVGEKEPENFMAEHVDLWSALLESTFESDGPPEAFHICRVESVRALIELHRTQPRSAEEESSYARLKGYLLKAVKRFKVVLLPIKDLLMGKGCQHYTLLKVFRPHGAGASGQLL